MILKVCVEGAPAYEIGDEIWQSSLADAIYAEAETIAGYAGPDLLRSSGPWHRDRLRDGIIHEMTCALVSVGDHYQAPDGVWYALIDALAIHPPQRKATLGPVTPEPIVEKMVRFQDLPLGSVGARRAIVRWSDGTQGAAMSWYADEIPVCEGDHGNSRLMSPRAEMHRAAGSFRAPRGT